MMQVRERGGRERGGRQKKGHKKLQGHLYINTSQDIKEKTERIAKGKQKIKRKERDRIERDTQQERKERKRRRRWWCRGMAFEVAMPPPRS